MDKNKAAGIGAVLFIAVLVAIGIALAQENQGNLSLNQTSQSNASLNDSNFTFAENFTVNISEVNKTGNESANAQTDNNFQANISELSRQPESSGSNTARLEIVNHLCGSHIDDISDFNYISTDKDNLSAYIAMIHSCPSVIIPGHQSSENSHKVHEIDFNLHVFGQNVSKNIDEAIVIPENVCESDVNRSLFIGSNDSEECLDVTKYAFENLPESISISENMPPGNSRLGAALLIPHSLRSNMSISRLPVSSSINVNASDGSIHLFNFINNKDFTANQTNISLSLDALNAMGWAVSQKKGYLAHVLFMDNNSSSAGILHLMTDKEDSKYILVEHDGTGNSIEFDLSNSNNLTANSGTLTLVKIPKSDFDLWQGLLIISEDNISELNGEYHIELGSGQSLAIKNFDDAVEAVNFRHNMSSDLDREMLQSVINKLGKS